MIETWKKTELDKLMRKHGLRPSKSLGQNFLVDGNTVSKIVEAAGLKESDHVTEIGPGLGALTVALAQTAGHVTAVEIDSRLIPSLKEAIEGLTNVEIVNEDFLKYELKKPIRQSQPYKLVGNLPYYITTPIIAKLFEPGPPARSPETSATSLEPSATLAPVQSESSATSPAQSPAPSVPRPAPPALAVLMVQKEVAERLLSPPGKKTYGAISVMLQYYAEAEYLFSVSHEVFFPKPGVDSAVIRLRPRDLSDDDPETVARMFRLVRAGFDMRRKTLRNSLARAGFPMDAVLSALEKSGVDPTRRAETLSSRDFYTIASQL